MALHGESGIGAVRGNLWSRKAFAQTDTCKSVDVPWEIKN